MKRGKRTLKSFYIVLALLIFVVLLFLIIYYYNSSRNISGNVLNEQQTGTRNLEHVGYIVEFQEESVVLEKENIKKTTEHESEINQKLDNYRDKLVNDNKLKKTKILEVVKQKRVAKLSKFNWRARDKFSFDEEKIVRHEFVELFNGMSLNISDDEAEEVRKLSEVKGVYPNLIAHSSLMNSVSLIGAPPVWAVKTTSGLTVTGQGIKIAIIDTGVDYTHPDLGGCLGTNCKVIGGYDYVNTDSDPMDDNGHGTHVASIAAGNGVLNGVAPGARILAYKVLDSMSGGSWDNIMVAINRAYSVDGAQVISLSLGADCEGYYDSYCGPDDVLSRTVDSAVIAGANVVVVAGNEGLYGRDSITSPGTARRAITVGATFKQNYESFTFACIPGAMTECGRCSATGSGICDYGGIGNPLKDQVTSYSGQGPVTLNGVGIGKPDIVAPGAIICGSRYDSIFPTGQDPYVYPCLDARHVQMEGTSMATPHVSGSVALIKQYAPSLTPQQIKDLITSNTVNLGVSRDIQGAGRIDLKKIFMCEDKDKDEYCNWGAIYTSRPSNCPSSCKALKDCNDADKYLGPADANNKCLALPQVFISYPSNGARLSLLSNKNLVVGSSKDATNLVIYRNNIPYTSVPRSGDYTYIYIGSLFSSSSSTTSYQIKVVASTSSGLSSTSNTITLYR